VSPLCDPTKQQSNLLTTRASMKRKKKSVMGVSIMLILIVAIVGSTLGRELMQGEHPGLLSFGLIHFAGYLFFLLMPVEALVPYYLAAGDSASVLIGLSVATALLAQTIDYGIGYVVSERVVDTLISREKFEKFKATFNKWGGWAIFTFNLFPLSSPNMMLVSGILRYNPLKAFAISSSGLLLKYVVIVLLTDAVA
jgi:membrane protein DedA with SNARE-associated domain